MLFYQYTHPIVSKKVTLSRSLVTNTQTCSLLIPHLRGILSFTFLCSLFSGTEISLVYFNDTLEMTPHHFTSAFKGKLNFPQFLCIPHILLCVNPISYHYEYIIIPWIIAINNEKQATSRLKKNYYRS